MNMLAAGLSERTYITTDRQVYVAGDRVWLSAFCVDAATGEFSDFSSIAYLELHSSSEMVCTAKVALIGGRGASVMQLPANLPTGNYKLLAYTALNRNEEGYDAAAYAKTISVYNTSSTARVEGGVEIVNEEPERQAAPASAGSLTIGLPAAPKAGKTAALRLNSAKDASLSVSVWHDDGIGAPKQISIADFKAGIKPGTKFSENVIPEYEGEILRGRVVGLNPAQIDSLAGYYAFISTPGNYRNVYSSNIENDGSVAIYTSNIYGDCDLVCEIENLGGNLPGHFELESPFVNVPVGEVEKLRMSSSISDKLHIRGIASQIEKMYDADTLFSALPYREDLLTKEPVKSYILDDYTRFPTMDEVIVEITSEIRTHRRAGKTELQMILRDYYRSAHVATGTSLVMLDGVPVFDHQKIMSFDPALIKRIDVYDQIYCVGVRMFDGIINITTFKGNMPTMEFDANVRIVDFHGPAYPAAFTCEGLARDGRYPDYRQTAYWHPELDLKAGETLSLNVELPAYSGRFVVTVEGLAADGTPVYATDEFIAE